MLGAILVIMFVVFVAVGVPIAFALGIGEDRINIKATTEEGMGFTGGGEGAAAHAVVLLRRSEL